MEPPDRPAHKPGVVASCHHPEKNWDTERLAKRVRELMPACLARGKDHEEPVLPGLEEIDIVLVDDSTIARVHEEFMDVEGATDVITFHHGEILISLDTAERQAEEHGENLETEVLRYAVHGLLHLNGWQDRTPEQRAAMEEMQEEVLGLS